jgi:phosphomannomutase
MDAVKKHAAVFGTEVSGHMCIPSLLPLDDAIAIAYFIAANAEEKISETVKTIPKYPFERVNLQCMDEIKFRVTERLKKKLSKKYKNVNTMDGIRIDFSDSWLLIRPSNTEPKIRLTIEADNKERLTQLKQEFTELLKQEIAF